VDINTIRAWLGHVSLDTTNIYAETDLATKNARWPHWQGEAHAGELDDGSRQPEVMAFLRAL